MNSHLSPEEFVDALEGRLAADRRGHVEACAACGREVAELRELTDAAGVAGIVPEPSPLFWDHFSRRVRAATGAEPIVAPRWWDAAWRPVAMLAVAGAVVFIALAYPGWTGESGGRTAPPPVAQVASAVGEPTIDEGTLSLIAAIASDSSAEDLQQATQPTMDATAAVMDELTPAQRAEFIRLIKAEMGHPE
jgi:hypothetical protein